MKYYVYTHKDPQSEEILYVGLGSFERAWLCRGSNRKTEHQIKLKELFNIGFTMQDIVCIEYKNLSKWEATQKEKALITKHEPVFNRHGKKDWKYPQYQFTEAVKEMIKSFKEMGYGCQNIAYLLGGDKKKNAMSVWRNLK